MGRNHSHLRTTEMPMSFNVASGHASAGAPSQPLQQRGSSFMNACSKMTLQSNQTIKTPTKRNVRISGSHEGELSDNGSQLMRDQSAIQWQGLNMGGPTAPTGRHLLSNESRKSNISTPSKGILK